MIALINDDHIVEEQAALRVNHRELKERARYLPDEQEMPSEMYRDAISSFNDEEFAVPCDLANLYFSRHASD